MSEAVVSPETYRPDPAHESAFRAWTKGLGVPVRACEVTVKHGTVPVYECTFDVLENLTLRAWVIVHEPTEAGMSAAVWWGVELRHASDRNTLKLDDGPSCFLRDFESALKVVDELSRKVLALRLDDTCRLLDLLPNVGNDE